MFDTLHNFRTVLIEVDDFLINSLDSLTVRINMDLKDHEQDVVKQSLREFY